MHKHLIVITPRLYGFSPTGCKVNSPDDNVDQYLHMFRQSADTFVNFTILIFFCLLGSIINGNILTEIIFLADNYVFYSKFFGHRLNYPLWEVES